MQRPIQEEPTNALLPELSKQTRRPSPEPGQFLHAVTLDMQAQLRALRELPIWVEDDLRDQDTPLPPSVQGHLDLMHRSARNLTTLLDGVLDLSRAGQVPDAPHRTTVQQAARRAWAEIDKGQRFTIETYEALETIFLPERAIRQVFKALLENAVHHHDLPVGHVTVVSRIAGNRVKIRVEDDGPGLDPSVHDRVFDPLFTMRSRDETGRAGLGLTIAHKLITQFGGRIDLAEASNGHGLAVHFDLPVRERW